MNPMMIFVLKLAAAGIVIYALLSLALLFSVGFIIDPHSNYAGWKGLRALFQDMEKENDPMYVFLNVFVMNPFVFSCGVFGEILSFLEYLGRLLGLKKEKNEHEHIDL